MNGFLAVVLVCAATLSAQDCSRGTAIDMAVSPAAHEIECLKVGEIVATRVSLQPGEYHKIACERRKGQG